MSDTIAAIATAPMKSAIGIIRISGQDALAISNKVFLGNHGENPRNMVTGKFLSKNGDICDFGMGVYFKAPASFTGEDCVEFYTHGSLAVLRTILISLYHAGARPANPGEFTHRAFLNGKMDLTQAEAIIDLIDSETELSARNAAEQMNGSLGREISAISQSLTEIASEFYAYIDYPDDEIPQTERDDIAEHLCALASQTEALAGTFEKGRFFRDGVKVALIGRPNVGKSSLLNALLGCERSIVTDLEGTTRDTIEENLSINSLALRLIDTAGLRDAETIPEQMGIERSRKAAKDADLVIAVFDGAEEINDYDKEVIEIAKKQRSICVINKTDLGCVLDKEAFSNLPTIEISAKEKTGTDKLLDMICDVFEIADIPCDGKTVTNPRHASTLMRATYSIKSSADAFRGGIYPDLAVSDIENAINILGEITGLHAQDAIIADIFSRFCVGK